MVPQYLLQTGRSYGFYLWFWHEIWMQVLFLFMISPREGQKQACRNGQLRLLQMGPFQLP